MAKNNLAALRSSYGFSGPEGAMFDEMNQPVNTLSHLINNDSISAMGMPQNYIQRTGGPVIDLGPSYGMKDLGNGVTVDSNGMLQVSPEQSKSFDDWIMNQQKMNIERNRLEDEQLKSQSPKLQFNAESGGFIEPPSAQNPQGRFIPVPGLKPKDVTKPPTEQEAKSAFYVQNMRSASKTMDDLEMSGYDPSSTITQAGVAFAGGMTNALASKVAQQAKQAQNQWSEQMLRMQTGAAATQDEINRTNATYFPQVGDNKGTVDLKRAMRKQAEQGVFSASGRAQDRVIPLQPREVSSTQDAAPPQGAVRRIR